MSFQIQNLVIKLSPCQEPAGCGEFASHLDTDRCTCGPSGPGHLDGETPAECEALTNCGDSEGDNYEGPAEAAHREGSKRLGLLQQQLRQTLIQQAL